jgi:lipopolysaccharide/colanic/teichoic acid biosynthesis glycosyltransferase
MTGLRRSAVGPRSDGRDAIHLDLYYVENWSTVGDLVFMWRTLKAVLVSGKEAY